MRDVHDPTTVSPISHNGAIDADGHILETTGQAVKRAGGRAMPIDTDEASSHGTRDVVVLRSLPPKQMLVTAPSARSGGSVWSVHVPSALTR
jgi:hypothetical protein